MQNYKKLLELLSEYEKTKIWKIFSGDVIFSLAGFKKPVYVSILGNAGYSLGLVVYDGKKELEKQLDVSFGCYQNFPDNFVRISCYEICIGDIKNLLTKESKEQLKKEKISSKNAIFRLEEGYLPRLVTEKESEFLIQVLEKIIILSHYLIEKNQSFLESPDFVYMDQFKIDNLTVVHKKIPFPTFSNKLPKVKKVNEENINKLLLLGKTLEINVGLFYAPMYIEEKNPYYPFLFIIENTKTNFLLGIRMLKPDEVSNIGNMFLEILIQHHFVPSKVHFNSEECLLLLRNVIDELNFEFDVNTNIQSLFQTWYFLKEQTCK